LHPAGISSQHVCGFQTAPKRSVQALTSGVEAEFAALVERQSGFVFRVAYAVLLNRADAEDSVQETFLKLYRNGGWHNVENERAFLARVAWRVAVDRLPRRPGTPNLDCNSESDLTSEAPSADPSPEQTLILTDQHARIHAMIDALPEELRVPLILSAGDELNSREIGRVLGIPEGTVRTRLQRARELLRRKLDASEDAHLRNPRIGNSQVRNPQLKEAPHA
jgi:RNA polymerase sigma-70 factor (ECF subfamily)